MTRIILTVDLAEDISEEEQEEVYGALLAQVEDYGIEEHSVVFAAPKSEDEEDIKDLTDTITECPF